MSMGTVGWAVEESGVLEALRIPPPPPGPDVCGRCRGWTRPGHPLCFPCRLVESQVSAPCPRVAVVSLYRVGGALHQSLRRYKDGADTVRRVVADRVAALAARYIWAELPGEVPEGWDGMVVVPSSAGRPGPHPLASALAGVGWLAPQLWDGALEPGPDPPVHRRASDGGYRVPAGAGVSGARLVVVDDTWTTGARAQSAASALAAAGADVAAIVVLGRVVTPKPGAPSGDWWLRHGRTDVRDEPDGR
jgi:hypothetical protein